MKNQIIYLKAEKNVKVKSDKVYLGEVFKVTGNDKEIAHKLKQVLIYDFGKDNKKSTKEEKRTRAVISILKVIELINDIDEDIEIVSLGENDIILEKNSDKKQNKVFAVAKVTFVSLICFFGTAFTIMAFHNDINVISLFEKIYELSGVQYRDGVGGLEFGYSLGLGAGIIIFYNHIGKRKITKDPTPLEVEMRIYEEDVNQTLIDNASRERLEEDV